MPEVLLDDDYWLDQGRHHGLDLTNRDQLLDVAAVGLTVLCRRNTRLEDVHAGVERHLRLELAGEDPEDAAVVERERRAELAYFDVLDADRDDLATLDPDETQRMSRFLDSTTGNGRRSTSSNWSRSCRIRIANSLSAERQSRQVMFSASRGTATPTMSCRRSACT